MSNIAEIIDFRERSQEHLRALELGIMVLSQGDTETINDVLRHLITLRTEAKFLNLTIIQKIAHYLTQYILQIRDYWLEISEQLTTDLLKLFDCLESAIAQLPELNLNQELQLEIEAQIQELRQGINPQIQQLRQQNQLFQEIKQIFPLETAVQLAAQDYAKQAQISLVGSEVAIPQGILKQLPRLLSHLINNAIAHGIELPEMRQALGKPLIGNITLEAYRTSQEVRIIFADDGAGINQEQIIAKAINKGIISKEQAINLTEAQIYDFLFHPNFSTKSERDLRAGTGYGLDIVRSELTKRGASIKITSKLGQGTRFEIKYPL